MKEMKAEIDEVWRLAESLDRVPEGSYKSLSKCTAVIEGRILSLRNSWGAV